MLNESAIGNERLSRPSAKGAATIPRGIKENWSKVLIRIKASGNSAAVDEVELRAGEGGTETGGQDEKNRQEVFVHIAYYIIF